MVGVLANNPIETVALLLAVHSRLGFGALGFRPVLERVALPVDLVEVGLILFGSPGGRSRDDTSAGVTDKVLEAGQGGGCARRQPRSIPRVVSGGVGIRIQRRYVPVGAGTTLAPANRAGWITFVATGRAVGLPRAFSSASLFRRHHGHRHVLRREVIPGQEPDRPPPGRGRLSRARQPFQPLHHRRAAPGAHVGVPTRRRQRRPGVNQLLQPRDDRVHHFRRRPTPGCCTQFSWASGSRRSRLEGATSVEQCGGDAYLPSRSVSSRTMARTSVLIRSARRSASGRPARGLMFRSRLAATHLAQSTCCPKQTSQPPDERNQCSSRSAPTKPQ